MTGNSTHTTALPEDANFMALALQQAAQAATQGEVPIGAVLVQGGQVVAQAHNAPIALCDPTAHAEVLALRAAAHTLANYRLSDCTLYVTAEPCAMCAGAIVHARLARVVYAVDEPRTGAAGSQINVFANPSINAHTRVTRGVLADAAKAQLQAFFAGQRERQKRARLPLRDDALRLPAKAEAAWLAQAGVAGAEDRSSGCAWESGWHWFEPPTEGGVAEPRAAVRAAATEAPACSPSVALPWRLHHWACTVPHVPDAPAVAMVHGWGQHSGVWRHWAQSAQQSAWQVLLPDALGHGGSDKPKRATTDSVLHMAQALLSQLQASAWAQARERVLVLDAGWLPLLCAHAQTLRLAAPVWHGVQWRWVPRPAQAGDAAGLRKPWAAGFPAQVASLRKLLQGDAAELTAWEAAFPDAGHLSLLRAWLVAWEAWADPQAVAGLAPSLAPARGAVPEPPAGAFPADGVARQAQETREPGGALHALAAGPAFAAMSHQWLHPSQGWLPGWPKRVAPMRCGRDLPALAQPVPLPRGALPWQGSL